MSQNHSQLSIESPIAKRFLRMAVASLLVMLSACSGDGRPLTEAVEANNLNLKTITIIPPAGQLSQLYLNPGQAIALSLIAKDTANKDVDVSSADRRWTVDQSNVLEIDENGNIYAAAEGAALVSVRIGGVVSAGFSVNVRDERLDSIEVIQGNNTLERCVPKQYQAVGRYLPVSGIGEGSLRGLYNVKWTVAKLESEQQIGFVDKPVNGFANVTGINVGNLRLVATVDDKSTERTIEVENTLLELSIDPELAAVALGKKLDLKAKGSFLKDGEPNNNVDITDAVQWSVLEETELLSIGNNAFDKGVVTTKAVGDVQIVAACGDLQQQKTVRINERGDTSDIGLSIEGGTSTKQLSLVAGLVQLRVSTGSTYNENNEVTESADWLVLEGQDVVEFNSLSDVGEITPLKVGTAKIQATYNGRVVTLNIRVNQL